MKSSFLKKAGVIGLATVFSFGCSLTDSAKSPVSNSTQSGAPSGKGSTANSTECLNRYYPVKNGLQRNYKMSLGGTTSMKMEFKDGEDGFTEVTKVDDATINHVWLCTKEGFVAANFGSLGAMKNMDVEPKHISGATLPREDEIKVGRTWQTIYEANGSSKELGKIEMKVTLNNKIVSIDETVKTPAGDFKAAKIEMDVDADMKFGGKPIKIPKIKSAAWFAPDVGLVKTTGGIAGVPSTMEFTGNN